MATNQQDTLEVNRVLLLGDVHGNPGWFKSAARAAAQNECQVILQLGDLGYWPHYPFGKEFWNATKRHCKHYGVECWWVDGNHENYDLLEAQPHDDGGFWRDGPIVHCGRGARWTWSGVRFLACGGAYSIDRYGRTPHSTWWPQELITTGDVYRCGDEPTDVLVSHDAPYGAKGVMGFDTVGEKDNYPDSVTNRLMLYQIVKATEPKLLLHGHYHHRNSTRLDGCQVEGFHRDGNPKSMGILELPSLQVTNWQDAPAKPR